MSTSNLELCLTVLTTFYKDDPHLDEMIRSVLGQTFRDFELLMVIDDNPACAQRIRDQYPDPRIRILEKSRSGIAVARNYGIRAAHAPLIAFIDSDDVCEPSRFEKQVSFLKRHPECALVGSAILIIDENSREIASREYPTSNQEIRQKMLEFNCLATSTITARKSAILEAGAFSEQSFLYAEDYDLWLRVGRLGELRNLKEPLVRYRIHSTGGKSSRTHLQLRDTIRVKIHAARHYGYPVGIRFYLILGAQLALRLLPSQMIVWLFSKTVLKRPSDANSPRACDN